MNAASTLCVLKALVSTVQCSINPPSHPLHSPPPNHASTNIRDRAGTMAAASTSPRRGGGVLTCAAALAALGALQTASAFLVVPPPSTSSHATLELARRPFVGCVRVDGYSCPPTTSSSGLKCNVRGCPSCVLTWTIHAHTHAPPGGGRRAGAVKLFSTPPRKQKTLAEELDDLRVRVPHGGPAVCLSACLLA